MKYLKKFFSFGPSEPEIQLNTSEYLKIANKIKSLLEIELEEYDLQVKATSDVALKDPVSKEFKFHYSITYSRRMEITNSYDDSELPKQLKNIITRFKSKYGFSKLYFPFDVRETGDIFIILSHLDPKTLLDY
jgi:hypothetical protein